MRRSRFTCLSVPMPEPMPTLRLPTAVSPALWLQLVSALSLSSDPCSALSPLSPDCALSYICTASSSIIVIVQPREIRDPASIDTASSTSDVALSFALVPARAKAGFGAHAARTPRCLPASVCILRTSFSFRLQALWQNSEQRFAAGAISCASRTVSGGITDPSSKAALVRSLADRMDSGHSQHCQRIERALRRARRVRASRASKQRRLPTALDERSTESCN